MVRTMKDSGVDWIGSIPEHWTISRTKNYYTNHKYIVGDKSTEYERLALTLNGVIKRNKEDTTGLQPEEFSGYQILDVDELVFKLIDLQNISTSRVGLSPYTGIVSPAYIILHKKNGVNTKFGEYFFLSMWQREIFNRMGDDGVRSSLNASDLLNIPYIFPPLSEQQKIAAFLDEKCSEIDAVLTKTNESIEEYKLLKNAIITQAVTKGIRPNRKMKDSSIEWIGEIPEDWDCFYLSQIFAPVKNKNVGLQENNLLSLSYGKIIRKNINTTFGLLPENFEGYNIIQADDLVLRLTDLQNDHKSLRVGLAKEKGIITSAYLSLRNKSNNLPLYFYYLLHTFDILKGFYGMGAGVRQGLNWDEVRSLRITAPKDISEQKEIVDYLEEKCSQIETLITKKEQLITELETYKKSLIYEYVTGKKEVQ
jgi:type I restriction enzyme S subunit